MKLRVEEISNDSRGRIFEIRNHAGWHINILTIHAGKARGGHSHSYPEEFFIVSGKIVYLSKKSNGAMNEPRVYKTGNKVVTVGREPHLALALEDTVMLEFRPDSEYSATNDVQFRRLVDLLGEN